MNRHDLARAACANRATRAHDPWAGDTEADVLEAQAVCASCPVRAACAVDGAREEHGVWGGVLRSPDVSMVVADARIRPSIAAVHGTRGTYNSGCRCTRCTESNRLYKAKYDKNGPVTKRPKVVDMNVSMFEGVSA